MKKYRYTDSVTSSCDMFATIENPITLDDVHPEDREEVSAALKDDPDCGIYGRPDGTIAVLTFMGNCA